MFNPLSVHFPLTSAMDKSQQHQNKFSGMLRIEPRPRGEEQRCYLCALQPPNSCSFTFELLRIKAEQKHAKFDS